MSELIFGIVWLILVVPMSISVIIIQPSVIAFFSIFYIVGICFVVRGVKRVTADKKTDKNGEICYGRIKNISSTGTSVNGRQELKATICSYIPSLNEEKILDEVIGFDYNKYAIGDYVKLKYYNNDVNIIEKVSNQEVPQNVLALYDNSKEFGPNIIYSGTGERLQPMNMPTNGTAYAWKDNNNQNNN